MEALFHFAECFGVGSGSMVGSPVKAENVRVIQLQRKVTFHEPMPLLCRGQQQDMDANASCVGA